MPSWVPLSTEWPAWAASVPDVQGTVEGWMRPMEWDMAGCEIEGTFSPLPVDHQAKELPTYLCVDLITFE